MYCKIHYETGLFLGVQATALHVGVCIHCNCSWGHWAYGSTYWAPNCPSLPSPPPLSPIGVIPLVCFSLHLFHLFTVLQAASLSSVCSTLLHQSLQDLNDFNGLIIFIEIKSFLNTCLALFLIFSGLKSLTPFYKRLDFDLHCYSIWPCKDKDIRHWKGMMGSYPLGVSR